MKINITRGQFVMTVCKPKSWVLCHNSYMGILSLDQNNRCVWLLWIKTIESSFSPSMKKCLGLPISVLPVKPVGTLLPPRTAWTSSLLPCNLPRTLHTFSECDLNVSRIPSEVPLLPMPVSADGQRHFLAPLPPFVLHRFGGGTEVMKLQVRASWWNLIQSKFGY